ncbi:MAG: hypothetical protein QY332_10915 [Anaerolineales bacterium]|nr:MAG: hypothetical protein QY332_10915 [Anaerolineales bacterium]
MLFIIIVPLMGPIQANERTNAVILSLLMLIFGMFAGAGLSFSTAFLNEQRKKREMS